MWEFRVIGVFIRMLDSYAGMNEKSLDIYFDNCIRYETVLLGIRTHNVHKEEYFTKLVLW